MKYIITDIDMLCSKCGFFEEETGINNGYGCTHPDCKEQELMIAKKNGEYDRISNDYYFLIKKLSKSKKITSLRKYKKLYKKAKKIEFSNKELKKIGLLQAGKCYSFSCPIASSVVKEDLEDGSCINKDDYSYLLSDDYDIEAYDLMMVDEHLANELKINY